MVWCMRTYIDQCCERAEAAEANAERAQNPEAKRIWRAVAGKWREIAGTGIRAQGTSRRLMRKA